MRCVTLIFLIFTLSFGMEKNVFSQEKISITKVVIDAGHGGKDPGTIGKKSQEKNIALQIALKLSEEIRSQCKGVTVICTRTTDEFIELHERAEIANRSKADMFISIHCNANPKHTFQGAETYVMGLHRTEANLEIAKKENAAILMEPDYSANYNGFDPNSDESYITFTLFQNAFLEQSTRFASFVQDEMKDRVGMNDRGVRQAGFLVLYKTTMPSVLVETGFLSNPEEEKFLMSEKGQQYIASAICRAFCKFKLKLEGNGKDLASLNYKRSSAANATTTHPVSQPKTSPAENKPAEELPAKDSDNVKEKTGLNSSAKESVRPKAKSTEPSLSKDTEKMTGKTKPVLPQKETNVPKEDPKVSPSVKAGNVAKNKPAEHPPVKDTLKPKSKAAIQVIKKDSPVPGENLTAANSTREKANGKPAVRETGKTDASKTTAAAPSDEVVFRIQIATSPKELSTHAKKFAGLPDVWRYLHQGSFKYTAGKETSPEALSGLMAEAKKMGFADAFIVAFHGSERITVAEAKKLISDKGK